MKCIKARHFERAIATAAVLGVAGCSAGSVGEVTPSEQDEKALEQDEERAVDKPLRPDSADKPEPTSNASGGYVVTAEDESKRAAIREDLQGLSWEEFRAQSTRTNADGNVYYIVEWDIPISTELELRSYYDVRVKGDLDKGVLHLTDTTADDVWLNGDQIHLRYCIDIDPLGGFGVDLGGVTGITANEMIDAMEEAATAWQQVAYVRFEYDSDNNGDCNQASAVPDDRYIKVARADWLSGACAFGPQSHADWTCEPLDGNTLGVPGGLLVPAPFTLAGVMMHELGHILGLHHEHLHTNGGGCATSSTRNLTPTADLQSIMGYPLGSGIGNCALTTPNGDSLSATDGVVARLLYGIPAPWYVPFL